MTTGLFSVSGSADNRIMNNVVRVLQGLSVKNLERLLGFITGMPEFSLITFCYQQVTGDRVAVDARIYSSFDIQFEIRFTTESVNLGDLRSCLERFAGSTAYVKLLIVLTPDTEEPPAIRVLGDSRVAWATFSVLFDAIDEILDDAHEVVTSNERLLLQELQAMLIDEALVPPIKDTVVVAARVAWDEYLTYSSYLSQPGRSLGAVKYIAFYTGGAIQPFVAKILSKARDVVFEPGRNSGPMGDLVDGMLKSGIKPPGIVHRVYMLSAQHDRETIVLAARIVNDQKSKSGKAIAFTMGRRYTNMAELCRVAALPPGQRFTSKLVK